MKLLIAFVLLISTASISQAAETTTKPTSEVVSKVSTDGKKSRRHKKMNKKRKRACAKWSKRSYAG